MPWSVNFTLNCLACTTNGIFGVTTSIAPPFRRQRLVIMRAQIQPSLLPSRKVVSNGDSAAGWTWSLSNGNVLHEGGCARDGWLVHLLMLPDVVSGAVALE